ncbi:MAG: endonuclease/exonuclease/phosphatase family protein [Myxococcales bacterium]|nr:endonuclease/exonuclease/phosphatase family protein [Myxococcales bacterium]
MNRLPRRLVPLIALCLAGCGSDSMGTPEPEPEPGPPQAMTVMTFNVLCSFCDSTYDPWDDRLGYFADLFSRYDPDLVGLQELAFEAEVDQLGEALGGTHDPLFFENPDNGVVYPDATIFYRRDRFEVVTRGEFWLSPTPDVPSSNGFAPPQLPRLVMWAELRDTASHRTFHFATTHFDNNSPSQELSAPLLLERAAPWMSKPVIIVGDFNSQPADEAYRILVEGSDGHPGLSNTQGLAATWSVEHNQPAEPAYDLDERIDHIFCAPQPDDWSVESWAVDLHTYGPDDRYPSDHWAMAARLTPPAL